MRNILPGIGLLFDNAIGEDAVGASNGPVDGGGVDLGDEHGLGLRLLVLLAAVVTVEVGGSAPPDGVETTRLKGDCRDGSSFCGGSFNRAAKLFPISEGDACLLR